MISTLETKVFNHKTASQKDFEAYTDFTNQMHAECDPTDPPQTVEHIIDEFKSQDAFPDVNFYLWVVWDADKIIAALDAGYANREENQHSMEAGIIFVLPDYRQQGIAKNLLTQLLPIAKNGKRTLIMFETSSKIPAGEVFAKRLGSRKGSEGKTNQLVIAELDQNLMQSWIDKANTTAQDFELGWWGNEYPEDELEAIAKLEMVMNTEPKDDLEIEDWNQTPERLREYEVYLQQINMTRHVLYARHKASSSLAGYTAMLYSPNTNPKLLSQGETAVVPEYRGHGLGKLLKATMVLKAIADYPEAEFIRTGNANSNAPMLAINHAMGFKHHISNIEWQLDVDKLESYLDFTSA